MFAFEYGLDSADSTGCNITNSVNGFLTDHFSKYVDYDFTANLEDELDAISRGEKEWVPLMEGFWQPFKDQVEHKATSVSRKEAARARELGTDPKSGRPVSVRMGRYGPYAQIGDAEDEDKPKFAGLLPGQRMDEVNLEQALELFKLPRDLGETSDGEPVAAGIGRFGPYIRYGKKYVSLGKEESPYTVNLERALELVSEKKKNDAPLHSWEHDGKSIEVKNGRYGPYATDGEVNASIPKSEDAASVTLTRVLELLEAKRKAPKRRAPARKKAGSGRASKGA